MEILKFQREAGAESRSVEFRSADDRLESTIIALDTRWLSREV